MSHLKKLTDMLNDKPELVMEMKQTLDLAKDLEYLTYFEAKKQFYFQTRNKHFPGDSLAREDLLAINMLSITDTAFQAYLNKKINSMDPLVSTLDKCTKFIGAETLKNLQTTRLAGGTRHLYST